MQTLDRPAADSSMRRWVSGFRRPGRVVQILPQRTPSSWHFEYFMAAVLMSLPVDSALPPDEWWHYGDPATTGVKRRIFLNC
jgi:hypothetical protein